MSLGNREARNRGHRDFKTRNYGAWLLCALLLLLCVNARLARYDIHQRTLKLATTQAYLDGAEMLRKLPKAVPLVLWQGIAIAIFVETTLHAVFLTAFIPRAIGFEGFDSDRYLRPPPVR